MIVFALVSCGGDNSDTAINNPDNYSFERNGLSTVSYTGQTDRILMATELITAMKDNSYISSQLLEMFENQTASGGNADPFMNESLNESAKSVKSKTAASQDIFSSNTIESAMIKSDFESWIVGQVDEVYPNWNELASSGQAGQIATGIIGIGRDVSKGVLGRNPVSSAIEGVSQGMTQWVDFPCQIASGIVCERGCVTQRISRA